jgi:hypothetical protein
MKKNNLHYSDTTVCLQYTGTYGDLNASNFNLHTIYQSLENGRNMKKMGENRFLSVETV